MKAKRKPELKSRPVIQLIRVSTLAQADEGKYGIPAQEEACARIALQHNLVIPPQWKFQIEDVSGSAVRSSPKMQKILRIVESGACGGIVMKEESRLMRKLDSEVLDVLKEHRVKLYLLDGMLDQGESSSKLLTGIKYLFSDYERDVICARMTGGKFSKRRSGEWASGRKSVAFGLELYKDGKADKLRPGAEIEKVIELFETFVTSGGFISFGELATKTRIPYKAVTYILKNEIYTGYHVPKKTAGSPKGKKMNVLREDGSLRYQRRIIIPVEERERIKMFDNPPISEALFAQAQRLLALREEMRLKTREDRGDDPFVYRGLLRCAECGRKMITVAYTNKSAHHYEAQYYVCQGAHGARTAKGTWRVKCGTCPTRRIRREKLEEIIDDKVVQRLANPKLIDELAKGLSEHSQADTLERLKRLDEEIEELLRSQARLEDAVVRGKISPEGFDRNDKELKLELQAARAAREKIRPNLSRMTPEMWVPIARKFKLWKRLVNNEKRMILASLGSHFEVAGYPGKKYHETIIKVKGFRLSLGGQGDNKSAELSADLDDGSGVTGLVPIGSPTYSASDRNQSTMYLTL
jgi:DNA invertase Pin-like site-specific DNA recombinase